jgi:hypothetical protein
MFHEHVKYCFAHLNSPVALKPCLIERIMYTYLNSALRVLLSSHIDVRGTKKKLNFVDQCNEGDIVLFNCISPSI